MMYLQVTESSNGEVWCEDGMNITKKIHTHFLCSRCFHRYKQIESYCKEQHGDRV